AKALQTMTTEPFLHVPMDAFIDMLPEALQDDAAGFAYEVIEESGKFQVVIRVGPVGERTLRGMRHAIAAMAGQGNNLIVDDVLCGGEISEYLRLLSGFDLRLVGVFAPLD
ncbi:MAG: chloramphenicol phosphotransferase, partial [Mesorhizobium sp.]